MVATTLKTEFGAEGAQNFIQWSFQQWILVLVSFRKRRVFIFPGLHIIFTYIFIFILYFMFSMLTNSFSLTKECLSSKVQSAWLLGINFSLSLKDLIEKFIWIPHSSRNDKVYSIKEISVFQTKCREVFIEEQNQSECLKNAPTTRSSHPPANLLEKQFPDLKFSGSARNLTTISGCPAVFTKLHKYLIILIIILIILRYLIICEICKFLYPFSKLIC